VRKKAFSSHLYTKNDPFAKTGSGQTPGNVAKRVWCDFRTAGLTAGWDWNTALTINPDGSAVSCTI
jgi:hypothetical protein